MKDLDARLLAAHTAGAQAALIQLYTEAADSHAGTEAEWFFLTQAYVFALELAAPQAHALHERLTAAGREA